MGNRKNCIPYYFSVEGDTEEWYLKHLQKLVNNSDESKYNVKFIIKIKKDPREMVKALSAANKVTVNHLCDIESEQQVHKQNFQDTLDNLSTASSSQKIDCYKLGYSNFSFDLWIALHKINCNMSLTDRKKYLIYLNKGYNQNFNSMDDYKHEDNFEKCLKQIALDDILIAIKRADDITKSNEEQNKLIEYKKYTYYQNNPSLSIHEIIKGILDKCDLLPKK